MKNLLIASIILTLTSILSCSGKNVSENQPKKTDTISDKNWQFEKTPFWSDEFNYTGVPDASKWGYDLGGSGWGNNELQFYTNDIKNAEVKDGKLIIKAIKETKEGKEYTSARIISKGKGDFLYGRIEFKAKLPEGRGTWPALWMLPTDWEYGGWPKSGEIDIMEHVGYDPNMIHVTVHTAAYYSGLNTQKSAQKLVQTATTDFHLYRIDWTPYSIKGFIDDVEVFQFRNENKDSSVWPFNRRFHLLMNLAIGGNWGGIMGVDDSIFPTVFEVDYVRVYKMIDK